MIRLLLVAVTAAAIGLLATPGVSGAQTSPTLTLEESCITVDGTRFVGVSATVSGVPPFSVVTGSISPPTGLGISGQISANEEGIASFGLAAGPGLYTVVASSLSFPFPAVQSLTVDCLPNNRDDCKSGGWQTFGVFKNEGDCVSFVATREKNQPGGSTG